MGEEIKSRLSFLSAVLGEGCLEYNVRKQDHEDTQEVSIKEIQSCRGHRVHWNTDEN